jgi:hypothetical protein
MGGGSIFLRFFFFRNFLRPLPVVPRIPRPCPPLCRVCGPCKPPPTHPLHGAQNGFPRAEGVQGVQPSKPPCRFVHLHRSGSVPVGRVGGRLTNRANRANRVKQDTPSTSRFVTHFSQGVGVRFLNTQYPQPSCRFPASHFPIPSPPLLGVQGLHEWMVYPINPCQRGATLWFRR